MNSPSQMNSSSVSEQFYKSISGNIDRTPMNENNKIESLKLIATIIDKIETNKTLGHSTNYSYDDLLIIINKQLKGSGEWTREAPLNYTSLKLLFVVPGREFVLNKRSFYTYTRSSPSNPETRIVTQQLYPAVFVWNNILSTSEFFEVVITTNQSIIDFLKLIKSYSYTHQLHDNIIKINNSTEITEYNT